MERSCNNLRVFAVVLLCLGAPKACTASDSSAEGNDNGMNHNSRGNELSGEQSMISTADEINDSPSNVRSRSVLALIQETQDAQEKDLAILKNEIQQLRQRQDQHQKTILQLQVRVDDNSWSVANTKNIQGQLSGDSEAFKALQNKQGVEIAKLQNGQRQSEAELEKLRTQLGAELLEIRSATKEHNAAIAVLKNFLENFDFYKQSIDEELSNKIAVLPKPETVSDAQALAEPPSQNDSKKEHSSESTLSPKISSVSHMDNSGIVVANKQIANTTKSPVREVSEVAIPHEQDFPNQRVTSPIEAEKDITELLRLYSTQIARLAIIEKIVAEAKLASHKSHLALDREIAKVGESLHKFQKAVSKSNSKTANNLRELDARLEVAEAQRREQDKRLNQIEFEAVNNSQRMNYSHWLTGDLLANVRLISFNATEIRDALNGLNNTFISLQQEVKPKVGSNATRLLTLNTSEDYGHKTKKIDMPISSIDVEHLSHQNLPHDCTEITGSPNNSSSTSSSPLPPPSLIPTSPRHQRGAYLIKPRQHFHHPIRVFCDFDGWTVIQRRSEGVLKFSRSWADYKAGFGDLEGEFWLGNDKLHSITKAARYRLLVGMWDFDDVYWEATYNIFYVDGEKHKYRLRVGGYRGNATDSMTLSNSMTFSTADVDNEASGMHCARIYEAGWWYNRCHSSNLNGKYAAGMAWYNNDISRLVYLKRTVMKIQLSA